ncbi:MAG: DUF1173 domain-containing protein [Rubrivivax sp.]|nr:DUF1173 domain-containing protein [Burkholderiales bacterium]MCW5632047.1 DUF1173 domain-containing protein [Rubrivivax sp.]
MEAATQTRAESEGQSLAIRGRVWLGGDAGLQEALAAIHGTPERPRCLCVPGGVEMYVAHLRHYVVKRLPNGGSRHHPRCVSFEPESAMSGLGPLAGGAIRELETGRTEVRVDFPWTRRPGRSAAHDIIANPGQVGATARRMSLRAVLHFLFERAGFNRWTPAMAGRRNQAVVRKYLLEAAESIDVASSPLADRLFVPETFSESAKVEAARRRREKLAVLRPRDGATPLALVIGEFKAIEVVEEGRRIWIRHMPDAPLLIEGRLWARFARSYAPLFEARDADTGLRVRLVIAALIKARRELTYEIDAASLMMTSDQWIPAEGVHELPLIDALVREGRRFIKPLRYDATNVEAFANALLVDVGARPCLLHLISPYMDERSRAAKRRAIEQAAQDAWVWETDQPMPSLPKPDNPG